jgi:hypothetical protein
MMQGRSFHSVKGGVGKSHLALGAAKSAALGGPAYLIETDLLGTSLVDALPVRAPRWRGDPRLTFERLAFEIPDGFHEERITRALIDARGRSKDAGPRGVPFLNDFLLYAGEHWDEGRECRVDAVRWQLDPKLPDLHVIPCSPLPRDIAAIEPLCSDEHHSAFIEGRLERLLALIAKLHAGRDVAVVFDCPRGILGVARAVLSLGLRLSSKPKQTLAVHGGFPAGLQDVPVSWKATIVVGPDSQDRPAAERWMALARLRERGRMEIVVNLGKVAHG